MLRALIDAVFGFGSYIALFAFFFLVRGIMHDLFPNDPLIAWIGSMFFGMMCPIIVINNLPGSRGRR